MKLLSIPEAAERIGCSRGHVYNLIAQKRLTRHDIGIKGPKTRVSDEDVDRFIRESEVPLPGDVA